MYLLSLRNTAPGLVVFGHFSAKDRVKYKEERELRLIVTANLEQDEEMHKLILINTKRLIGKVVVHAGRIPGFQEEVRQELRKYLIPACVAGSQLQSSDLTAVARPKTVSMEHNMGCN